MWILQYQNLFFQAYLDEEGLKLNIQVVANKQHLIFLQRKEGYHFLFQLQLLTKCSKKKKKIKFFKKSIKIKPKSHQVHCMFVLNNLIVYWHLVLQQPFLQLNFHQNRSIIVLLLNSNLILDDFFFFWKKIKNKNKIKILQFDWFGQQDQQEKHRMHQISRLNYNNWKEFRKKKKKKHTSWIKGACEVSISSNSCWIFVE